MSTTHFPPLTLKNSDLVYDDHSAYRRVTYETHTGEEFHTVERDGGPGQPEEISVWDDVEGWVPVNAETFRLETGPIQVHAGSVLTNNGSEVFDANTLRKMLISHAETLIQTKGTISTKKASDLTDEYLSGIEVSVGEMRDWLKKQGCSKEAGWEPLLRDNVIAKTPGLEGHLRATIKESLERGEGRVGPESHRVSMTLSSLFQGTNGPKDLAESLSQSDSLAPLKKDMAGDWGSKFLSKLKYQDGKDYVVEALMTVTPSGGTKRLTPTKTMLAVNARDFERIPEVQVKLEECARRPKLAFDPYDAFSQDDLYKASEERRQYLRGFKAVGPGGKLGDSNRPLYRWISSSKVQAWVATEGNTYTFQLVEGEWRLEDEARASQSQMDSSQPTHLGQTSRYDYEEAGPSNPYNEVDGGMRDVEMKNFDGPPADDMYGPYGEYKYSDQY